MLGQHIKFLHHRIFGVLCVGLRRLKGCLAFQHLEAVRRNEQRLGGKVELVVRASDALEETARSLRRADVDNQIDIAPVDAEFERRGADDGAELALAHRGLHFPPLRHVQRAMVKRDGKRILIRLPERLEDDFGLGARVDEDERHLRLADLVIDFRNGIERRMTRPWHALNRGEDPDIGPGARLPEDERRWFLPRGNEPCAQRVGVGHGGGKPDAGRLRRMSPKPAQGKREQDTALRRHHGVQLVENHRSQVPKQMARMRIGHQEGHLLGRGDQNVWRVLPLALALGVRRIAGAGFDRDGQPHIRNRCFEVPRDVDGQRLQGRDIERVDAMPAAPRRDVHEARQEARQRLAAARGGNEQDVPSRLGMRQHRKLVGAGAPATVGEPIEEALGQAHLRPSLTSTRRRRNTAPWLPTHNPR